MNLRQAKPHFLLKESYSVVLPQIQAEELTSTDYAIYDDYRYPPIAKTKYFSINVFYGWPHDLYGISKAMIVAQSIRKC